MLTAAVRVWQRAAAAAALRRRGSATATRVRSLQFKLAPLPCGADQN